VSALHDLFGASVGASAALIGLLFVAISLAPEKVFGGAADAHKRADAVGAFTALANVFFVSLAGLLPRGAPDVILVIAAVAIVRIVRADVSLLQRFPGPHDWRNFGALSIALYLVEGLATRRISTGTETTDGLMAVIFALYGYSLGVAWKLLGADDRPQPR
jgi:hypothetical protein